MRKYCNFCGEPMLPDAKECKQCGWDVSQNGPPTTDPGDRKARIGVSAGLAVAYVALWALVQSAPAEDLLPTRRAPTVAIADQAEQPVADPALDMGRMQAVVAATPATPTAPAALISIKVADAKNATVGARDAVQYAFVLPEIDHYNAMAFAEKVRKLVEVAEFKFEDAVIPVTISIGVSSLRGEIEDALEFIKQADTHLFAAKESGRNKVCG